MRRGFSSSLRRTGTSLRRGFPSLLYASLVHLCRWKLCLPGTEQGVYASPVSNSGVYARLCTMVGYLPVYHGGCTSLGTMVGVLASVLWWV